MPLHNYLCERKAYRLSVWKKFVLQVEGSFSVVFGNKAQWSLLRLCLRPPTQGFVIVVGAARTRPSLFNAPSVKVRSDNKSKLHSRRNEIVASFRRCSETQGTRRFHQLLLKSAKLGLWVSPQAPAWRAAGRFACFV